MILFVLSDEPSQYHFTFHLQKKNLQFFSVIISFEFDSFCKFMFAEVPCQSFVEFYLISVFSEKRNTSFQY